MEAAQEIEQTIRLSRDRIERDIARYRIWFFAVALLATTGVNGVRYLQGVPREWYSPAWFLGCLGYALVARAVVHRHGAAPWLTRALLALDMFAAVANFLLMSAEDRVDSASWAIHVTPAALMFIVLINLLRNDTRGAVVGAGIGFLTCVAVLYRYEGLQPQLVALGTIFALAASVGVASARQARRNLDLHGRMQLLRRYLSPAAVSRVLEDRPDSALALGGELVTVTVLASDLRGFTAMSEKLTPQELVAQLNGYHGAMLAQIDAHGGTLDKFMGDGMLAIFGLDVATGAAAEDAGASAAVNCARQMLKALERHNADRVAQGLAPLKIGIGLHTGAVVAGNIGAPERRLEFTIIGDAVNTSARLEALTKEAGTPVIVSETTADKLRDPQALVALPAMKIRGKDAAVRLFRLADPG